MPRTEAQTTERTLLQRAAAAGVTLSEGQAGQLLAHLDLLERWNRTYNLTSVRQRESMLSQHLLDCLAVVPAVRRELRGGGRILDVGSGGGLPGVVLAVLLPDATVTCVDAVAKKAAFVRQVSGTLGLVNLSAVHARVEALDLPPFDLITSRAFAALDEFVNLTSRMLVPGGAWMAMKGRRPDDEIAALPAETDVFHVEPIIVPGLEAERCLVWMRRRDTKA